jgi:hypothetical protein
VLQYNADTKEVTYSSDIRSEGDINIDINLADSTLRRWRFGEDGELTFPNGGGSIGNGVLSIGNITFPNATVQTTAYIAPTASYITSAGTDTISRNGMTIKITADLIIQMSFDYDGNIRGRFAVNGAASSAFTSPSPNGVVTVGVYYDIGTAMTQGDHLVATIVSASLHKVWRVTVTMRDASPEAGAYAVIEQLK